MNPITLASDTATEACSVALHVNSSVYQEFAVEPRAHSKMLLPMIEKLCKTHSVRRNDIQLVAFGRGPGSFTGLRIAASVAQGLGFGLDIPVIGVSTLRAIAQKVYRESKKSKVLVCNDARMQEVYWGAYQLNADGIMIPLMDERVESFDKINKNDFSDFCFAEDVAPESIDIITLAQAEFAQGKAGQPEEAIPMYVRNKVVDTPA